MVRDQMIFGSGMIGRALSEARGLRGTVAYAAGVSNSSCTDTREFDRDRERLAEALLQPGLFVYFSTCSVEDKPYTAHKHALEALVRQRRGYLICRLPIVAGRTSNPHTLLNYLYARISRSERFTMYAHSRRAVIDVRDVVEIVQWLVREGAQDETVNVAPPRDWSIQAIVGMFEGLCGKPAVLDEVRSGDAPKIDTRRIEGAPVDFSGDYLQRTIGRYYK